MTQCQRCGATNEPTSRFCVACGAPLVPLAQPGSVAPAGTARPPAPVSSHPPGPAAPSGMGPAAVIRSPEGPPSSGLPFAETAAPPTREGLEPHVIAARAAHAAAVAQGAPAAGHPEYMPGVPGATAAMPGVAQDPEAVPQGAPRILAAFLVSYDTQPLGRFWPIFQGANRIGRYGSGAELDIELDHPTASSRHASILAAACPGRVKIEDLGSTNGTFVNGARLPRGTRMELKDGDLLRFGLLSTTIKIV